MFFGTETEQPQARAPLRRKRILFPSQEEEGEPGLPNVETGEGTFTGLPDRSMMREAPAPAAPDGEGGNGFFSSEPAPPEESKPAAPAPDRFGFGNVENIQRERPNPKDYQPSKWRRFGAALSAGMAEFGHPGGGTGMAERIINAPYDRAMGDWSSRLSSAQGVTQAELQKFGAEREVTADTRAGQDFAAKMQEYKDRSTLNNLHTQLAQKQLSGFVTPEQAVAQRKAWVSQYGQHLAPDVAEAFILSGQLKPDKTMDRFEFLMNAAHGNVDKARQLYEEEEMKFRGAARGGGADKARPQRASIERWKAKQYADLEAAMKDPKKRLKPQDVEARKREIEAGYRAQKLAIGDEVDESAAPAATAPAQTPAQGGGRPANVPANYIHVQRGGQSGWIPPEDLQASDKKIQ